VFAHQRESIPLTCIYSGWRVLDFAGLRFVIPAKAGIHFDVRASNRIPDHLLPRVRNGGRWLPTGRLQPAVNHYPPAPNAFLRDAEFPTGSVEKPSPATAGVT
jgi:hypothetical protein